MKTRCLRSSRGRYSDRNPSLGLEGKWLRNAGFWSGGWAHIIILDGVLIIRCEKMEEELQSPRAIRQMKKTVQKDGL